jgi:hypothetical protein
VTEVTLNLNGLVVGKDEILVLTLPGAALPADDDGSSLLEDLIDSFDKVGLKDRVFLIVADGIEMAKVQK